MTATGVMVYTLVTFDLDGTLVDTAGEIAEAANRTLADNGFAQRSAADISLLIGQGAQALMRTLLLQASQATGRTIGPALTDTALQCFDAHYAQTVGSSAAPYPGAVDTLRRLRLQGVKLACVTNKELRHTLRVLQANQLDDCFDLVNGGDSLPEKKPNASVLRAVAQALGCALAGTAHVGDSAIDVASARNAGVTAWAVPYGYNGGLPISASQPDRIFQHLAEIADHVLAGRAPRASEAGR